MALGKDRDLLDLCSHSSSRSDSTLRRYTRSTGALTGRCETSTAPRAVVKLEARSSAHRIRDVSEQSRRLVTAQRREHALESQRGEDSDTSCSVMALPHVTPDDNKARVLPHTRGSTPESSCSAMSGLEGLPRPIPSILLLHFCSFVAVDAREQKRPTTGL